MHQPLFLTRWIIWDRQEIIIRPKKILLFPEMRVTKKIFTRAAAKKSFFINLIDFFKWSLHLKNYSLCWKIKSPIFYFFKGKKRRFVRINLLVDFFVCVCVFFLNKKRIYSYTWHAGGQVIKNFSPSRFPETRILFLALYTA